MTGCQMKVSELICPLFFSVKLQPIIIILLKGLQSIQHLKSGQQVFSDNMVPIVKTNPK